MADVSVKKLLGGGGGNFALGIEPPKASTEFYAPFNASFEGSTSGDAMVDKGWTAPVADTRYAALQLLSMACGGATSELGFARAKAPSRTAVWTNLLGAYATAPFFCRGYWYDAGNNQLYTLHGATSQYYPSHIYKTDVVSGVITLLVAMSQQIMSTGTSSGNMLWPDDPSDPDNSVWNVLAANGGPPVGIMLYRYQPDGTQISALPGKVDSSGTNQSIQVNGGYMSAAKDIVLSELGFLSGDSSVATFVLTRSSSTVRVFLSRDGALPLTSGPAIVLNDKDGANSTFMGTTLFVPWGNSSLLLLSDSHNETYTAWRSLFGRRLWDRADFDRWLHEIADFYNMPPAEPFFT